MGSLQYLSIHRLWLNDLRDHRPEFADQVHVFSSFFYTQLNHKKYVSVGINMDASSSQRVVLTKGIRVSGNGRPSLICSKGNT